MCHKPNIKVSSILFLLLVLPSVLLHAQPKKKPCTVVSCSGTALFIENNALRSVFVVAKPVKDDFKSN